MRFETSFEAQNQRWMQWRLVALSYGTAGAMIVKQFLRRPNRGFLSAQPLNHLGSAIEEAVNFLTLVGILIDGDREITKSAVVLFEFLISVIPAGVNCKKIDAAL